MAPNASSPSARTRWLSALVLSLVLAAAAYAQTAGIVYIYDEAGRLVGVVDPSGDAVTYTYDALGNLLSISRYSASGVSVIEFTPNGGAVGTAVTIYGTGFSATPSQNAVSFNGAAATVTAATATQLTTSVPAGATTGPISVTTPGGSATSGASFTVGGTSAPTVTGFTPNIGVAGTSVAVSGTNFQTVAAANKVRFNVTHSLPTAATATGITTSVPRMAGSGRVTVSTTAGTATSADDFFIPPSGNTAADVAYTGRAASGESKTVSLGTANKIGMVVFDALAGQRVGVKVTGSTITNASLAIYKPNGAYLTSTSVTSGGTSYLEAPLLGDSGTYAIVVDPVSTYTGGMTVVPYVSTDVTGAITPGGSAVAAATTVAGQRTRHSFSATAGQRVSLKVSGVSVTGGNGLFDVYIVKPDGTVQASDTYVGSAGTFIDTQTLATAGTYTVVFDPQTTGVGGATLTLYDVPADAAASITPGGSAVAVTTTTPGQNAVLSFGGTSGQRVSFKASGVSMTGGNGYADFVLRKPDGTTLTSATYISSSTYVDTQTLPADGTYTVLVNPQTSGVGSATVTLYDVAADITGTITPGGSPVTVTTTTPGQNGLLTFSGTSGQRVSIRVSAVSMTGNGWVNVYLKRPDGATVSSDTFDSNGGFLDVQTLPTTGTYTVLVDPYSSNTGTATVTLYDVPADATGGITPGGSAVTVSTTTPGQNAVLSFSGTSGQRVSLKIAGVTMSGWNSWVYVYLKKPDGTTLTSDLFDSNGGFLDVKTLPTTGTYTILVDPYKNNTGGATVTLYDVPADVTGSITPGGSAVPVTTTVPGQNAVLSFSGTANQRVSLRVTGVTMSGWNTWVYAYLRRPDGTTLASDLFDSNGGFIDVKTLPTTGTYTVLVDPYRTNTGGATVTLYDVPADPTASVTVGGAAATVTTTAPGQNASVTFSGTSGQQVTVRMTSNSVGTMTIRLFKPDGTQLATTASSAGSFNLSTQTLPATGTYTVTVDPMSSAVGSVSINVTNP